MRSKSCIPLAYCYIYFFDNNKVKFCASMLNRLFLGYYLDAKCSFPDIMFVLSHVRLFVQ
jgi:hypothetical protein